MSMIRTVPLDESMYLIQVHDHRSKYFEGVWDIPEGVTYNAYVLKTPDGAVVFDTVKATFTEDYLNALWELVSPDEIKHIVIHHMEPDHSGSLPALMEATNGKPEVWGHAFTKRLLASMYGLNPTFHAVKDGTELNFGGERMVFYLTPWLHWPETMVTYLPERRYLLTGDILGGFGTPRAIFDDNTKDVEIFRPMARKYFATVVGHYKENVTKQLPRLKEFGVHPKMVLPAHGLLWRNDPEHIYDRYVEWAQGIPTEGKVVIAYTSMYGYAEEAIGYTIELLKEHGISPIVFRYVDEHHDEVSDFLGELPDAQALILGTATYEGGMYLPMKHLIEEIIHKANYNKPLLVLGAYGWAGAAGKEAARMFEDSAYNLVDVVEFRGKLDDKGREKIKEGLEKLLSS